MKRFSGLFRKDNICSVIRLILSFFAFVVSNLSLLSGLHWQSIWFWVASIVCVGSLFLLMLQIFQKYERYRSFAHHLQRTDMELFFIMSYLSMNTPRVTNKFRISNIRIIYDIPSIDPVFSVNATTNDAVKDFVVTYEVPIAINSSRRLSTLYHKTLTSKRDHTGITAKYKFDDEREWLTLSHNSQYSSTRHLDTWSATKTGGYIQPNRTFGYKLRFSFEKGFSLLDKQCFMIDPSNYATNVDEIEVIFRSQTSTLKDIIRIPTITKYTNGMNCDDTSASLCFEDASTDEFKTCYALKFSPESNARYIMSIFPITQ